LIKRTLTALLLGIGITVLSGIVDGALGGARHCLTPITIFFPYGTAIAMHTSWESLGVLLGMLQFPLYTIVLASLKDRPMTLPLLILLGAHAAASAWALALQGRMQEQS
jgi:hypothetical protein